MLSSFLLSSRANQFWYYSGIDSPEQCRDQKHFDQYPYAISYQYNSRGFRGPEWSSNLNELNNSVWCIGDSFTVGIGNPIEHTWPYLLEQRLKSTCINVAMDGASNEWMSRKISELLNEVTPKYIIIHWTYSHRREMSIDPTKDPKEVAWENVYNACKDTGWPPCPMIKDFESLPTFIKKELLEQHQVSYFINDNSSIDEFRRVHHTNESDYENIQNLINCINQVELVVKQSNTKVIHSVIPRFVPQYLAVSTNEIIKSLPIDYISEFPYLDIARDGHHYGLKTSQYFVEQIADRFADSLISV